MHFVEDEIALFCSCKDIVILDNYYIEQDLLLLRTVITELSSLSYPYCSVHTTDFIDVVRSVWQQGCTSYYISASVTVSIGVTLSDADSTISYRQSEVTSARTCHINCLNQSLSLTYQREARAPLTTSSEATNRTKQITGYRISQSLIRQVHCYRTSCGSLLDIGMYVLCCSRFYLTKVLQTLSTVFVIILLHKELIIPLLVDLACFRRGN